MFNECLDTYTELTKFSFQTQTNNIPFPMTYNLYINHAKNFMLAHITGIICTKQGLNGRGYAVI